MTEVSIIGLGKMGGAIARVLLDAGHRVTVWNRTPGRADHRATVAATPAEAVAASPVVVICVLDYPAVHAVLDTAGPLAGKAVVNVTNGTPDQAREVARKVGERGGYYLDGGIMTVPQLVGRPVALALYSGHGGAFERHQPLLDRLATSRYLGEDPGTAALYDLAMLTAMYGVFTGYFQAVALAGTERVVEFTDLVAPWLPMMTASLPRFAEQIEAGVYTTDVSSIDVNQVGFGNLIETAKARGVDTTLITPVKALLDRAVAEGHGADSLGRLVEQLIKEES